MYEFRKRRFRRAPADRGRGRDRGSVALLPAADARALRRPAQAVVELRNERRDLKRGDAPDRARARPGGVAAARSGLGALHPQDLGQRRLAHLELLARSARACPPRAGSRSRGGAAPWRAACRSGAPTRRRPRPRAPIEPSPTARLGGRAAQARPCAPPRCRARWREQRRDEVGAAAVVLLGRVGGVPAGLVGARSPCARRRGRRPVRRRAARAAPAPG